MTKANSQRHSNTGCLRQPKLPKLPARAPTRWAGLDAGDSSKLQARCSSRNVQEWQGSCGSQGSALALHGAAEGEGTRARGSKREYCAVAHCMRWRACRLARSQGLRGSFARRVACAVWPPISWGAQCWALGRHACAGQHKAIRSAHVPVGAHCMLCLFVQAVAAAASSPCSYAWRKRPTISS